MEDWNRNKMIRINLKDIYFFFSSVQKVIKKQIKREKYLLFVRHL